MALGMTPNPVAEVIAQIAERERHVAVRDGDYIWAVICAIVEASARSGGGAD